jgi:hypothetical protein
VAQVEARFAGKTNFLVDFDHLSEYLAAASELLGENMKVLWFGNQGRTTANACRRYPENRVDYLDYKTPLKEGLPISSGETESGHRWVIQVRVKIAGAWWKTDNAERMLKLRTMRERRMPYILAFVKLQRD